MVEKFIDGWARFVVEKRWWVIIISIGILLGLMIPMQQLYFDNSNEMWFLPGDVALDQYEELREKFGSSQYLIIGIQAREGEETVITRENLQSIAKVTEFLEDHEFVTKVSSLSKYQYIYADGDTLQIDDLIEDMDELPDTPEAMERIRKIMAGEKLVHDFMITKDLKHTIISARTLYIKGEIDHQVKLVHDINAFFKKENFEARGYHFRLAGNAVISENFLTTSMKDTATTMPLMFLLVVTFLWYSFRRISGMLMPLVVIIGSVFSVFGILGIFGWAINSMNVILPVILMTIGIGDSVHILVDFFHFIDDQKPAAEAAQLSIKNLFIPCFNTSLTTSLGFLAISSTALRPIREFGLTAAVGVNIAFLISVTTLPALLSFLNLKPKKGKKRIQGGPVARMVAGLMPFDLKHRKVILLFSAIVVGMAVWFTVQIRVDTNFVNNFKEKTVMRQDMVYFDDIYNGGYNLEFIVDSGEDGGVKNPRFLKRVLALQEYMESLPNTGRANSMLDYIRKMNQVMNGDNPEFYRVPETREYVAQLLLLYSNSGPEEDLSDLKSFDERFLRLSVKIRNMRTSKMQALVAKIEAEIDRSYRDLKVDITGDTVLWNNMSVYIQEGMISSFSIAFVTIVFCFFILLHSVRYGILATVPSIIPILIGSGLMGAMEIDLDFSTMMVAAICFGIAVDDTIHVMVRYIGSRKKGQSRQESIHIALMESGRALIFTSLILYFGFSILMLSSFVSNIYFGFFSGVIIIVALVANLVLLPALMMVTGDKK